MTTLITGGCGFLGSNIAARLIVAGERPSLLDNLSRHGSQSNLTWLRSLGPCDLVEADVRDEEAVRIAVKTLRPEVVFHLAGQVAMTTSLERPRFDFEVNVLGTLNVLEAVRAHAPGAAVVYSSSNKVYGDLGYARVVEEARRYSLPDFPDGVDEAAPLSFHTPYGCSKGAADQYVLDYARMYGLNTIVFRHSTIYGGRQFATYDQGWVGWFCLRALEASNGNAEPFDISGDGKQVRDLLHVDDAVDCYLAAARHVGAARGEAFNIGGGMKNSCSLLELFDVLERSLSVRLSYRSLSWRVGDQRVFVADCRKASEAFQWSPAVTKERGIELMLQWTHQLPTT